jgi:hypothetical protein
MKIVYEDAGVMKGPFTAATNLEATFVKVKCNGKPFYCWPSIPAGQVIGCDFTGAPVGTGSVPTNQALIDAITADPAVVLTYAP